MARVGAQSFIRPHVLVVEGLDDFNFCVSLLEEMQVESVQVVEIDGINNLSSRLGVYRKTPGFDSVVRIGVLVDSDTDPIARLQSIRGALAGAGLAVPTDPMVFEEGQPAVIYSCIPSPQTQGCLEDLLMSSLSNGLSGCVNDFMNCAAIPAQPWSSRWCKAWVHAYLSATGEPGLKIGEAIKAKSVDIASDAFDPVRTFLRTLTAP